MFEIVFESIEQVKDFPAVKSMLKNHFVRARIDQFKVFLDKFIRKNIEKTIEPSKKKLTTLNRLLINLVVLAYFLGLAEAKEISDFKIVFDNFKMIGLSFIVVNLIGLLLMRLSVVIGKIIWLVLNVFAILFVIFLIYLAIMKLINWYRNQNVIEQHACTTKN